MTRRNPPPGQIAQIQVPGVSAQPLGGVRPASPPPPDLSRLQRFRGLSQSVERFLGASADNDRLKSSQEAAAAFAQLSPEAREKINSADPQERIEALNAHFDQMAKDGIISRADHPRFQAFFREQALRAEVGDLNRRLEARLSEAQAIYDDNGSLIGGADPEAIFAEEMEDLAGTFAFGDPFARRQVGEELVQSREQFLSAFAGARAQAMEQASRDQVTDQAFNLATETVSQALGGGTPIEDADLSPLIRIMSDAREKYGQEDARRLVIDGVATEIGRLRSNDRFNDALALLGRLEGLRDSNRNPIVRDADTATRLSELREALEREAEVQEDRDWREGQQLRQRNLQTADNDILRLVLGRQTEGATFAQIEREAQEYIDGQPSDIQGVLLDNLDNLLEQEKREAFASDPEVLENFRSAALTGGLDTAEILAANQAGEITAQDAQGLLDQVSTQRSMLDALPPVAQQAMEQIPSRYTIEGAPASLRNELADIGLDRELELRARLEEYWVANQDTPPAQREAEFRRITREFDLQSRQDAATIRQDFQSRSQQARERILGKEGTLTLTLGDVYAERDNLSQEAFESALSSVRSVDRTRQDLRAKTLGPFRSQLSTSLTAFAISEGLDSQYDPFINTLQTAFTQELDALADRFEAEVLPNTDPSRVGQAYREFMQTEFNDKVLPKLDPMASEIINRMQGGEEAGEVVEEVREATQDPTTLPVNVELYPELEEFSMAQRKEAPRVAARAIRQAPPERQADLFLQVAPRLGIKAQEVLDGQIVLESPRQVVSFGGIPARTGPSAVVPISILAETTATKYQVPLFTSQEEFGKFTDDNDQMERLMQALQIPAERRAFWAQSQLAAISRVHGQPE